ncbi:hypothetical protein UFOVP1033_82 [uncultured Caudovirales phage]|uniref:Uncharacterized protein n=1 Tax=uncultured Caudovirales phage TaxID=2100421 RepID=A0A6J5SZ69_9CAUD|nr:hypothetical protein UFOVP1033_82 [uncultured Caudovirales phage]CAB4220823.1 hypothetical protein UFOVP1631_82 [uncultured Caudovirales phage]
MKTLSSPSDDFGRKKPGGAYTNRAVGESVPDRGEDPKRKMTWDVHNNESGEYQYSFKGGSKLRQSTKNKHFGSNYENEIVSANHSTYPWAVGNKKRKFK